MWVDSQFEQSVITLTQCPNFYMWTLINHFVEHSLCYKLVKTRSHYYFSIQSYGIF